MIETAINPFEKATSDDYADEAVERWQEECAERAEREGREDQPPSGEDQP